MTHWLSTEIKNSQARLPMALLTTIAVASIVGGDAPWVGWWQNTMLRVHAFTAIVFGIGAAAVAAWQVSRSRKAGISAIEGISPVPGPHIVARITLSTWVLAVGAFVVLSLAALARTALVTWGAPPWGLMLLTVCLLWAQISVGGLLGVWLPRWLAPVATVALLYVGSFAPIYFGNAEHTWGRLYPVIQQGWDPFGVEDFGRLAIASLWLVVVGVLLTICAGLRRPWRRPRRLWIAGIATVAGMAALGVIVPRVAEGAQFFNARGAGDAVTCVGGPPARVCVWADNPDVAVPVQSALVELHRVAGGLTFLPTSLVQAGIPLSHAAGEVEWSVDRAAPTTTQAREIVVMMAVPDLPSTCLTASGEASVDTVPFLSVPVLISERLGLSMSLTHDEAHVARLRRLDPTAQDRWINAAIEAQSRCLPAPPVPAP